jgi:hypothetical protein
MATAQMKDRLAHHEARQRSMGLDGLSMPAWRDGNKVFKGGSSSHVCASDT